MNYEIVKDEKRLLEFINWLPDLEKDEQFYGCLFTRKKYDPTGVITSDKGQLKRFTSNKDFLYQKIKQLETVVGTYQYKGQAVPEHSLALYIMPNPRSFMRAARKTLIDLAVLIAGEQTKHRNPHKIALNNIQKHGRKVYIDFDFDIKKENMLLYNFKELLNKRINRDSYTIVETRGGYHVLIELSKIEDQYKKSWYQNIQKLGADVTGDVLLPVVGAIQGGFVPKFV